MKYYHNLIIGPSKYIYFNKKGKKSIKKQKNRKKMQLEMKLIRKTEENIEIDKKK